MTEERDTQSKKTKYDLSSYSCVYFFSTKELYIHDIIQLDDETIVCCTSNNSIKRWNLYGNFINSYIGHTSWVNCLMNGDDRTFLSGSSDSTIKVWSIGSCECLHTLRATAGVNSLLRLRNNSTFVCGLDDGYIEEWRMKSYEKLHSFKQHTGAVVCLCELSNGAVVSGSGDNTLKVWNMKSQTLVQTLTGHEERVQRVIELRDKTIASASEDRTICIWEATTGKCLRVLKGHTRFVNAILELSGGPLLSGSGDETIREWNDNGECVSLSHMNCWISCLKEIKDGSIVIGNGVGAETQIRRTWIRRSLVERCCEVIVDHQTEFDIAALTLQLPSELSACLDSEMTRRIQPSPFHHPSEPPIPLSHYMDMFARIQT
eukprot:TRINITY_DN6010_c0_g1_i1.p1 TRINITY_DN6010_c0_g1~~TRINITY_DN6010_c0_g1_i1.p1  ORF type:complete len:375 (-),score=55.38 TRINITY_DN6010_c0_g1_i1:22-1146(-)